MTPMIGQHKLISELNVYTTETLPQAIMLLGPKGCGKHTLAANLAERLEIELLNVDPSIEPDELLEYQLWPNMRLYVLDFTDLLEKQQNKFLKFLEEYRENVRIVVLANSEVGILSTVLSRCVRFNFEPYTIEELSKLDWMSRVPAESLVYKICRTPGQLKLADQKVVNNLYNFCLELVSKNMSYNQFMSQLTNINFAENYNKFDFENFFDMMSYVTLELYTKVNNIYYFNFYMITQRYISTLSIINKPNREQYMFNYFSALWKEVKNECQRIKESH